MLGARLMAAAGSRATLAMIDWDGDEVWGRLLAGASMAYGLGWIVARIEVVWVLLPPTILALCLTVLIGGDHEQKIG